MRQTSESSVALTFPQTIIQLKVCGWMWFQSMGFSWQYIIGSKIDLCHQRSFQVCIWCLRKRVCQNVSQIHISPAIYLSFLHIKHVSQDTFITQTLSRRIDRIWNELFNGDKQILVTLKFWKIISQFLVWWRLNSIVKIVVITFNKQDRMFSNS